MAMTQNKSNIKAGHIVQYRGRYNDRVTAVVSSAYVGATGEDCLRLKNGLPIREELCTIVGFECPHCGRKYNEEPWECTSDDCPQPVSKQTAYENGSYEMPVPPVHTSLWKAHDWIAFIDKYGHWTVEVE